MNIADIQKLRDQAAADLTTSQARLAVVDADIKQRRDLRRQIMADIHTAMGALKFAEFATRAEQEQIAKTSPALERQKAAAETASPETTEIAPLPPNPL